jgi:hypothetical protein
MFSKNKVSNNAFPRAQKIRIEPLHKKIDPTIFEMKNPLDNSHFNPIKDGIMNEYTNFHDTDYSPDAHSFKQSGSYYTPNHCYEDYNGSGIENTRGTINDNREKHLTSVREHIKMMRKKAEYFQTESLRHVVFDKTTANDYHLACLAAEKLADNIELLANQYAKNEIELPELKCLATKLFDERNKDIKLLNTHRGWKEFLINALAALLGNVLYLAAAVSFGTFRLFKPATDAGNKVKCLAHSVENITADEDAELDFSGDYQCSNI